MGKKTVNYLFVNTHYLPDLHFGGVVESGSKLFKYLRRVIPIKLLCVSKNPNAVKEVLKANGSCYESWIFHRFGFSWEAIFGLWKDIKSADVLLINGIFTFPVTLAQFYAVILKKPFIVATRGGLELWRVAHKRWKKYLYIKLITLPLMRRATFIHVTSDVEGDSISALGFSNTFKVTNGIDLEMYADLPDKYSYEDFRDQRFIFLFMSRTDKEKGLDILIEAYRRFCKEHDTNNFLLLIVGPDHQGYLKRFNLNYEKENIVRINGVYGDNKIKLIRRSDVVVLPSYSENFGNIVAEALACERPVITTAGTPWNETEKIGCGYYIQPNKEELYIAMKDVYQKSKEEREAMGKKGRKYIFDNFSWESKAKEMYEWLKKIGDMDNVHEK